MPRDLSIPNLLPAFYLPAQKKKEAPASSPGYLH